MRQTGGSTRATGNMRRASLARGGEIDEEDEVEGGGGGRVWRPCPEQAPEPREVPEPCEVRYATWIFRRLLLPRDETKTQISPKFEASRRARGMDPAIQPSTFGSCTTLIVNHIVADNVTFTSNGVISTLTVNDEAFRI